MSFIVMLSTLVFWPVGLILAVADYADKQRLKGKIYSLERQLGLLERKQTGLILGARSRAAAEDEFEVIET